MSLTRRRFIQSSLTAGAVALSAGVSSLAAARAFGRPGAGKLRVLILGGTGFIGPHLVEIAQKRGHEVSVFNRGITEGRKGKLPGAVERLVGDRDPDKGEGIKALEGKKWEVVFDDTGFYPRHVKASAELLAPNVKQYIYISSISAYKDNSTPNQDETAELATLEDPTVETMGEQFQNYGGLKVLCEQAAEKALPGRTTIIRPGYIVGPGDGTDRFTCWPVRVQRGGEVLAPGTPSDAIQIIDVRDLAAFMMTVAENNTLGTFNACGPEKKLTMGAVLDSCKTACGEGSPGSKAELTWVSSEFITEIPDQLDLPIWAPPTGEYAGVHTWSNARAIQAGLTFTPVLTTIKDLLEWFPKEIERRVRVTKEMQEKAEKEGTPPPAPGDPSKIRAGLTPEKEAEVLKKWHEKIGA